MIDKIKTWLPVVALVILVFTVGFGAGYQEAPNPTDEWEEESAEVKCYVYDAEDGSPSVLCLSSGNVNVTLVDPENGSAAEK